MAAPDLPIPQYFACRMADIHGGAGADWLRRLSAIAAECAQRLNRWRPGVDLPSG